jgi:hypothetical protein
MEHSAWSIAQSVRTLLWHEEKTERAGKEPSGNRPSEEHLTIKDLSTTSPFRKSCVLSILASMIKAISYANPKIVEYWWQDPCTLVENDPLKVNTIKNKQ